MRRREFISLLGSAVVAWPLAARAQQAPMPVVGFLHARSLKDASPQVAAFVRGMAELGYMEGRNLIVEYRWAEGQYERLPAMAADLVQRSVRAIFVGTEPAAKAVKSATTTIPIVFSIGGDPVELGLVASFNRPGSNATGMSMFTALLEGKRLGILHDLLPQARTIGVLFNPGYTLADAQVRDIRDAARSAGIEVRFLAASTDQEIAAAFAQVAAAGIAAILQAADPFLDTRREMVLSNMLRYRVPMMHHFREFPVAGALMSYGIDILDVYRQCGIYVARILKGEKPADLPVVRPTKFELVINLKTAKALRIEVPPMLLARADEVIE